MTAPDTSILCQWDGEVLRPYGHFWSRRADKQWTVGERYMIEIREDRSDAAHKAYFAALNEAFMNLPEHLAERYQTVEALRKGALIACGYRDERSFVASSKAEALRIASFVKPPDDFAIVSVSGATVVVLTAKSQSYRAMGRAAFNDSRGKVLDFVSSLIGTTTAELQKADAA